MHVEALATRWLAQPDKWREPGIWERLRRLLPPLTEADGIAADPRQLGRDDERSIHDLARSVLERTNPRQPLSDPLPFQSPLVPITRSVLAAVGSLDTGEYLLSDAPVLARVAGLGRGLTAATRESSSQRHLLDSERHLLMDLFLQVTRSGQAYVLLPLARW